MGKLDVKTAIITGASSGFGRGTALAFAREGANLVLSARREERLKEVCAQCEKRGVRTCVFCPHAGHTEFEVGHGRTGEQLDKRSFLTGEDVGARRAGGFVMECVDGWNFVTGT